MNTNVSPGVFKRYFDKRTSIVLLSDSKSDSGLILIRTSERAKTFSVLQQSSFYVSSGSVLFNGVKCPQQLLKEIARRTGNTVDQMLYKINKMGGFDGFIIFIKEFKNENR